MDVGVESMRRRRQPLVPVLTSTSSRVIIAWRDTQRNIRTASQGNLFHQAGSTVVSYQDHLDLFVF